MQSFNVRLACTTRWLVWLVALCLCVVAREGSSVMNNSKLLDTSRYFADPKVAAFVDSVQEGDTAAVERGLAAGIPVNAAGVNGFRPIHFAFTPATPDVLKLLLRSGADPNAALANGNTPLHFAVRQPDPGFTTALLTARANPNAAGDSHQPVLFTALPYKNAAVVEALIRGGADVNAEWGHMSPLFSAITGFDWSMATALLNLGADPNFKDQKGWSALDELCKGLGRVPTDYKDNRAQVRRLLATLRQRGVALNCPAAVQRWQ